MKEFLKNVPNSLKYPAEYIAYFLGATLYYETDRNGRSGSPNDPRSLILVPIDSAYATSY